MKKILWFLIISILLILIAAGIFLATFDINRYRSFVIQQLEAALGNPVEIRDMALSWRNGIAVEISDIVVKDRAPGNSKPLQIDKVSATLEWKPLLERKVEFGAVYVDHPVVTLIRQPNGTIDLVGYSPEPSKKSSGQEAWLAGVPLLVDRFQLRGGELIFKDRAGPVHYEVPLTNLDISVHPISFSQPIQIAADASLFSAQDNLFLNGELQIDIREQSMELRGTGLTANLSRIDLNSLTHAFPQLKDAGLVSMDGKFLVTLQDTAFRVGRELGLVLDMQFEDGQVRLQSLPMPIEGVQASGRLNQDRFHVSSFHAQYAGGTIEGSAQHDLKRPLNEMQVRLTLDRFDLQKLAPARAGEPQLTGVLSGTFQGSLFSGTGSISIPDARVKNLNILRDVFSRLTLIPGVVDTLRRRLPEHYEQKLSAQDTVFKPIVLSFVTRPNLVSFPQLQITTDSFEMTGQAVVSTAGALNAQLMLFIDPDLSLAFIKSIKELQYLTDANGRLQIPVRGSGVFPNVSFDPDLGYVGRQLAVSKVQDVVGGLLQSVLEQTSGASETQTQTASSGTDSQKAQTAI